MNALSRIERRTKLVLGLLMAVCLTAAVASVIHTLDSRPELRITLSHFGTDKEFSFAVFDIENVGNAPTRFYGYGPDSPSCDLVQKDANGLWQNRIFKCGTGLSPQLMFPGAQIRTTNYIHGNDPWKLGLTYTKPEFRDRLPAQVQSWLRFLPYSSSTSLQAWSEEMPPPEITIASRDPKQSFE